MKYRMLGVDMDGTLLNEQGEVSQANVDAIKKAQDAGVLIVPCTGRAWHESHAHLKDIPDLNEGIFATGAAMHQVHSGETLDTSPLPSDLAHQLIDHMAHLPEPVLVLRDHAVTGHHYYVASSGEVHFLTKGWFEKTNAVVSHFNDPDHQKHETDVTVIESPRLEFALRVGIITSPEKAAELNQIILTHYETSVTAHAFAAVQETTDGEVFDILEIFAADVNKWEGLKSVAARHHIDPSEIAVIGDQINDLSMMNASECGIAMGNAVDSVKQTAKYQTVNNEQSGVAVAIENLLSEKWR